MTSERDRQLLGAAVVIVVAAAVAGFATLAWLVGRVDNLESTADQVLDEVQAEPLVTRWELHWVTSDATIGAAPLEAVGTFTCTDTVTPDLLIQFESSLRPIPTASAPSLQRVVQLPIRAGLVCSDQPVSFPIPWSQLLGLDGVTTATDYRLEIQASASGFDIARAETTELVTIRPQPSG